MERTTCTLVWFLYSHYFFYPFITKEIAFIQLECISDKPEYYLTFPLAAGHFESSVVQLSFQIFHCCERCFLLHNDNHKILLCRLRRLQYYTLLQI